MECPKCRHKIYLDLTLEDLIFCPYCDQRMVPPKEFNLCPVCGGELPIGAEFCLKCGEKLVPEERPVIDHTPVNPSEHSREDISSLVTGEPPVAQERGSAPVVEELPVTEQITALPADQYLKNIYGRPVVEEPSVAEKIIPEPLEFPVSRTISPAVVEKQPVIEHVNPEKENVPFVSKVPHVEESELPHVAKPMVPEFVEKETVTEFEPVRTTFEVDEEAEPPVYESSYAAPAESEPPPPGEFGFCIACGQKLPPEALYCLRCGKSTVIPGVTKVPPDQLKVELPVIKPEGLPLPPVVNMPVKAEQEPAPVSPQHIEPKYRPVSSREPISNAMADFAPSMPHHPNARVSNRAILRKVWHNVRRRTANALNEAWDFTKGLQKGFREIFSKLFEEREIIPVDMSSAEALKHAAKAVAPQVKRPIPRIYIILGAIIYIALFVVIGITISRCSSG